MNHLMHFAHMNNTTAMMNASGHRNATASMVNSTAQMSQNLTCTHADLIYNYHSLQFLCQTGSQVCSDSFQLINFL